MPAKARIKQSFAEASGTYDDAAVLQRQAGKGLLKKIGAMEPGETVLDLGCGTGFLLEELIKENRVFPNFIALDIAYPMLQRARTKLNENGSIAYLCADAEFLPLQPHSVDCVISNLALQWCLNLAKVFSGIRRVLKPGGRFGFTTFGPNTLQELKRAWQAVDNCQHVNDFHDQGYIGEALLNSGFKVSGLTMATHISYYESVWDLMYELKQLGAQTVIKAQKNSLSGKSGMQRMVEAYQRQAGDGLIPATFETITVIAARDA